MYHADDYGNDTMMNTTTTTMDAMMNDLVWRIVIMRTIPENRFSKNVNNRTMKIMTKEWNTINLRYSGD